MLGLFRKYLSAAFQLSVAILKLNFIRNVSFS
jgi:hypothetical protein